METIAEKRKVVSDNLSKENYELNQKIQNMENLNMTQKSNLIKEQRNKNEKVLLTLKKEIKDLNEIRKQNEIKMIDSNRRLDELLEENKNSQKVISTEIFYLGR